MSSSSDHNSSSTDSKPFPVLRTRATSSPFQRPVTIQLDLSVDFLSILYTYHAVNNSPSAFVADFPLLPEPLISPLRFLPLQPQIRAETHLDSLLIA